MLRIAKNHLTALVGSCTLAGMNEEPNLQGKVNKEPKKSPAQMVQKSGPRVQMPSHPAVPLDS